MIKSIKKFSHEKRSKTLGLLTIKKGMSNLTTIMRAKVKVCLITHTHKGRSKAIRVQWKKRCFYHIICRWDSETEEITGAKN